MKPSIVILALLIGAFALGDLASVKYIHATHQLWPDLPGVILLGLVFSQMTFVAVWSTFARWNIVVRLLVAVGAVFGLALVAANATDGARAVSPWFAIQLVAFCFFVVPLWIAKLLRWHISLKDHTRPAARMSGRQFSIWGLLSVTTAAAIALGTARQVDMPLIAVGEAAAFFSCITLTGLLVFAVAMAIRWPAVAALVTLPVVVLVCPLAGLLTGRTGLPPEEHPVQWAVFGFCYGAAIAIAALALRIAGYRFQRDTLTARAGEDDDHAADAHAADAQAADPKGDAEGTPTHQARATVNKKVVIELPTTEEPSDTPDAVSHPWLQIQPQSDDG